jgi:hypothetical protein
MELTELGIEALISSAIIGALLLAISSISTYGSLIAGFFGLALLIVGVISIWSLWEDHSNIPMLGVIFVLFGLIFEFGALTDITAVLPACILIDAAIFFVCGIVTALGVTASKLGLG